MTTEQAYIEGFVKRAADYGYSQEEALNILKQASPETLAMSPGALTAAQAGQGPVHQVAPAPPIGVSAISPEMSRKLRIPIPATQPQMPAVAPQHNNDLGMFTR
jgi:hypothetical protein